jgi:hypothetical protein
VCAILAVSFIEAKTNLKNNLVSFADTITDSTDSTETKTDTTTDSTDVVPEDDSSATVDPSIYGPDGVMVRITNVERKIFYAMKNQINKIAGTDYDRFIPIVISKTYQFD